MSKYDHRVTIACPTQHTDAANQLALILGESPADVNTFGALGWQDAQGNQYSVCSFVCTADWFAAAKGELIQRHDADMPAAAHAQSLLLVGEDVTASPSIIACRIGHDAIAALAGMGLELVQQEDDS